jgi:small subunit ribosomal protein S24e
MDFEITRDVRNELLNRRELTFTLTFDGPTPSRKSIQEKLAAMLNKREPPRAGPRPRTRFGKMELYRPCPDLRRRGDQEVDRAGYLLKRGEPKAESEA